MTVYEATIAKLQRMPEPMLAEVQDFVDFLLTRNNPAFQDVMQQWTEMKTLAESDMSNYLSNLEDYQGRLVKGEIKW